MMDATIVGQILGGLLLALGGGGAGYVVQRRRANGHATPSSSSPSTDAQQEVLRQSLHEARHAETLRILESVTETTSHAATAAREAAEGSKQCAQMTERIAITLDERLPRR